MNERDGQAVALVVAEDSDEDFDTVREVLGRFDAAAELIRAVSGDECIDLVRNIADGRRPLVLMDLNMPGVDGREALAMIKGDALLRSVPVVILSTSSDPRDLAECYGAGASAYHVKPVSYPEHVRLVHALLDYWLARVLLPVSHGERS